jgi:hypothetical protein
MKKLMMITMLFFIANVVIAQTPNPAKENFKSKYPDATNVYWKNEKDNMRVNYVEKDTKRAIVYDKTGNIVSEEMEVQATAIPPSIADYHKKRAGDSPNATYTVWEVKDREGNISYYSDYQGKTAYFDKDGNISTRKGMAAGDDKEPVDNMQKEK